MKLLIIDRDGVVNHDSDDYIKSLDEWYPIISSISAIAQLYKAGWTVAIATNQSGISRELYNVTTLEKIHDSLRMLLKKEHAELGYIAYCPHGPNDGCSCRKPKPGLLQQIASHYLIDLRNIWFVGDSLSDLLAANAAGCQPILVKTGKGLRTLTLELPENTLIFDDLASVAQALINNH
ncbi:UNVERIFIED_CONTAM: hypothetical protein GTU68_008230 [Idotea baltica]|nr:hypothetical protein [Idotea baltica]